MVTALAVAMAVFHLAVALTGPPEELIFRPVHLVFVMILIFLVHPLRRGGGAWRRVMLDGVPLAVALAALGYILFNQEYVVTRFQYVDPLTDADLWLGGALVLLVLEAARRVIGAALPVTAGLFLAYALLGPWLPLGNPDGQRDTCAVGGESV